MNRTNETSTAGVQGSWLWDETNFHVDDIVDITYTDPDFVPSYTTPSIPDVELKVTIGMVVDGRDPRVVI